MLLSRLRPSLAAAAAETRAAAVVLLGGSATALLLILLLLLPLPPLLLDALRATEQQGRSCLGHRQTRHAAPCADTWAGAVQVAIMIEAALQTIPG